MKQQFLTLTSRSKSKQMKMDIHKDIEHLFKFIPFIKSFSKAKLT